MNFLKRFLVATACFTAVSASASNRHWETQELWLDQISTPANPASGQDKLYTKSGDLLYILNSSGVETAVAPALASFGSAPNANGASVSGLSITLQPASQTNPGGVSTGAQTFGGVKTFSAGLDAGSNVISDVADPTSAQNAATKNYVDTQLAQLNPAAAVYAASTANIVGTYMNAVSGVCIGDTFTVTATGALSMDGVSPPAGFRVLLKNQTSSFQDAIWIVTVAGSTGVSPVLTRALDSDSVADFNSGQIVPIVNGTANAGASYYQTATTSTCNSSAQTWTQFQPATSAFLQVANNLSDIGTRQTALNNIAGAQTSNDILACDGTNCGIKAMTAAMMPTASVTPAAYTLMNCTVTAQGTVNTCTSGAASAGTAPTVQSFTSTGSTTAYFFTISSATTAAACVYTNNGHTFTVVTGGGITSGIQLIMTGTGAPGSSGTLTYSSGGAGCSGAGNITFSVAQTMATYTTPTSPSPLYLRVRSCGGGGGGGGGGSSGGANGGSGLASVFGTNFLIANGGLGGEAGSGAQVTTVPSAALGTAIGIVFPGTLGAAGWEISSVGTGSANGGKGGDSSLFNGGGLGYQGQIASGTAANANSGGGGGGGGGTSSSGGIFGGQGGISGACFDAIVNSPAATYYYAVGTGGALGGAGTSGSAGFAGAAGQLNVEEHYQ